MPCGDEVIAYLAGPDVFRTDAIEHGKLLVEKCKKAGFDALYPLDNVVPPGVTPEETSLNIFNANIKLIKKATIVIANLDDFRGPECDSGTVWEIGFAIGLGKVVYGYCSNPDSIYHADFNVSADPAYPMIENFGNRFNLMIAHSIIGPFASVDEAIDRVRRNQVMWHYTEAERIEEKRLTNTRHVTIL